VEGYQYTTLIVSCSLEKGPLGLSILLFALSWLVLVSMVTPS
jgi:hypothetical protein